MKQYCEHCNQENDTKIIQMQEEYPVRGYPIKVDATVRVCVTCGQPVWDSELDDQNLQKAFRQYRQEKGLLMPEEIKAIREQYGLSQVAFARVLGLGDKTIARYEGGSIQDEAQNNLIFLAKDPRNFQKLRNRQISRSEDDDLQSISAEATMPYPPAGSKKCRYRTEENVLFAEFRVGRVS